MKHSEFDAIRERGRGLEEAFFRERDRELLDALRRRVTAEEARDVLAAATGVTDTITLRELSELDAPQFLAVLGLFPLAEVAWCDGQVSAAERNAVLKAAADMGVIVDSPPHRLLERWLESRPAEGASKLWADYVHAICATLKPETVTKLREGVLERANKIARTSGGILGMGDRISAAERDCIAELAKAFVAPNG